MAKHKKNKKKKKKAVELPELPVREPLTWLGVAFRIWILHFAALVIYMIIAIVVELISKKRDYRIITMISIVFYLAVCYIIAYRSGYRDHAYEDKTGKKVTKWGTVLGTLISQCPGFILAVLLQFMPSTSKIRMIYEYLYMPFAYPVSAFEHSFRPVFFTPLLFAPIIVLCAYFAGRMAELKEQRPSKRLMRIGARVSGIFSRKKK